MTGKGSSGQTTSRYRGDQAPSGVKYGGKGCGDAGTFFYIRNADGLGEQARHDRLGEWMMLEGEGEGGEGEGKREERVKA